MPDTLPRTWHTDSCARHNGKPCDCGAVPFDATSYRAGLAEGFRRGVKAAADLMERQWCAESGPLDVTKAAIAIRALRQEGDKT